MATIEVMLEKGLKVGDEIHRKAVLKELSAGDVMAAADQSERVVMVPTTDGGHEAQLLVSNAAMGVHTLRRQIASLGGIQGPLELEQMALLSHADLELLQAGAEDLDKVLAEAIIKRGRSDAAGDSGEEQDK